MRHAGAGQALRRDVDERPNLRRQVPLVGVQRIERAGVGHAAMGGQDSAQPVLSEVGADQPVRQEDQS